MYSIAKQDYSHIHNGLCYLRNHIERLSEVLNKDTVNGLNKSIALIEQGLAPVRKQDDDQFNRIFEMAQLFGEEHKLQSVWSIYDIGSIYDPFPFSGKLKLYDCVRDIPVGAKYSDVWLIVDEMIKEVDEYHIFIERFYEEKGFVTFNLGS